VERFRWWVVGLRDAIEGSSDAKFIGILALVVLLAGGGYIAADRVSQAGAQTANPDGCSDRDAPHAGC
jgi:hypothetical protein